MLMREFFFGFFVLKQLPNIVRWASSFEREPEGRIFSLKTKLWWLK